MKKRKLRSDYGQKSFRNPFYGREKKQLWLIRYWRWSLAFLVALLIFISWALFISPWFRISRWQIEGLERISPEQVEMIIKETSRSQNLFVYPRKKLEQELYDRYNFLEIKINRKFFKKEILLVIKERKISFIYKEAEKYYYIDQEAHLIEEILADEAGNWLLDSSYPLIENLSEPKIKNRQINIKDMPFNSFLEIKEALRNEEEPLRLKNFVFDNNLYSFRALLNNDCFLLFSSENSIQKQLEAYFTFKNGRLPGSNLPVNINLLKKVDLRDTAREEGDKRIYYELK